MAASKTTSQELNSTFWWAFHWTYCKQTDVERIFI